MTSLFNMKGSKHLEGKELQDFLESRYKIWLECELFTKETNTPRKRYYRLIELYHSSLEKTSGIKFSQQEAEEIVKKLLMVKS